MQRTILLIFTVPSRRSFVRGGAAEFSRPSFGVRSLEHSIVTSGDAFTVWFRGVVDAAPVVDVVVDERCW